MIPSAHRAPDPIYRNVLVPLDGSDLAAGALSTAGALAARFGATVHTIHVDVDSDVPGAIQRQAAILEPCIVCLSTHGRGRVAGTLVGSTARDIIERGHHPVVVAGPFAGDPFVTDRLVVCVDGTEASELGIPVAAAWAHGLGLKLSILTVAEPCLPPVRIGAPWRRHHGPNEDADQYIRRLTDHWALESPGSDGAVVYDPIGPAPGMEDYLAANPTGLIAVTSHRRDGLALAVFGSDAGDIVHRSTVPALVIPTSTVAR